MIDPNIAAAWLGPFLRWSVILLELAGTLTILIGAAYATVILGIERPRIGMLSNGEEAGKGTTLVRSAHEQIAATPLAFVGNIDASELFSGAVDVIVCDGFTGNVVLKTSEGLVEAIDALMADEVARSVTAQVGAVLSRGALRRFRARLDYSEYGGAPLLGVRQVCVIGHGRSSPRAIATGVRLAARFARERLVARLEDSLHGAGPGAAARTRR